MLIQELLSGCRNQYKCAGINTSVQELISWYVFRVKIKFLRRMHVYMVADPEGLLPENPLFE